MARYTAGQRWSYRTREQDVGSTLLIGKVQKGLLKPPIIHVMVEGVASPTAPSPIVVWHMAFSEKAMDASVLELIEVGAKVDPKFEVGVAAWKEQKGGVFDSTVAEAVDGAVDFLVSAALPRRDDLFDEIVTEMRAKRSEELVAELYRQLFALEQWVFLCEPDDPRAPVQWVFPDGANPAPALLAFTSPQRAAAAAVSLGLYPAVSDVSIMPVSVKDAVRWIAGPDCANEWLCFNLTQQNFPLYRDDAVRLLEPT